MCLAPITHSGAQETISGFDFYGPAIEWQHASGLDVAPIHGGLLPNGKLFFLNNYKFFKYSNQDLTAPDFVPEYMFLMDPSPAYFPPPATVTVEPQLSPLPPAPIFDPSTNSVTVESLTCGAHALLDDGRLFFASGARATVDLDAYDAGNLEQSIVVDGLEQSVTYDASSDSWTRNPDMVGAGPDSGAPLRWYATVTRLADSRMLVTGGYERVLPAYAHNNSVEIYDPATDSWSPISDPNNTPDGLENPDYTHVFQFPWALSSVDPVTAEPTVFDVALMLGGAGEPMYLFHGDQSSFWYQTGNYRPGAKEFIDAKAPKQVFPNHGASTVLLPLRLPEDGWGYGNGSLMVAGGAHFTPMEGNIDVYDVATDSWRPSISMQGLRHHNSTVLLPDGRVLILGGHDDVNPVKKTGYAQYLDPKIGLTLFQGVANMPEVRGYHSVAILLPDGRVLLGGGNPGGRQGFELTDFRYYYPDYMFEARPQILYAEDRLTFDDYHILFVPHLTNVDDAALVGLASMTHSFDMNQRHVQLRTLDLDTTFKLESGAWNTVEPQACTEAGAVCIDAHAVQAPERAELAPPGHYLLFILDENRIPSPGQIVKLE